MSSSSSTTSSSSHGDLTTIVVIGGNPSVSAVAHALPAYDFVVAADSGLHDAHALGLNVNAIIGDMDSVDEKLLADAETAGAIIKRAPRDKDATDTELALLYAAEHGAQHIVVVTGGGGRLDHQLGVLNVLFHPKLAAINVEMFWDTAHVLALRGPGTAILHGRRGEVVGLLPIGADASGITTDGLTWSLTNETIPAYSTRGVSNELIDTEARISLTLGHLLIIRPHALEI
ncbi:MAG: thiamine diphosphokinase [Ilumatobacteraceae bacterium]